MTAAASRLPDLLGDALRPNYPESFPPGPRLAPAIQLYKWLTDPIDFLERYCRPLGERFAIRFPGFGAAVVFTDPEGIRDVFRGSTDVFYAGQANAVLEPIMGQHSVLLLDGPEHLRQRRLLLPPFHGERMNAYAAVMRDATTRHASRWPEGASHPIHATTQAITLEVILRAVFGVDDGDELRPLTASLGALMDLTANPLWIVPLTRRDLGRLTPWRRMMEEKERSDALIYGLIARRRALSDEALAERSDVLSMLLRARDEDGNPMSDAELYEKFSDCASRAMAAADVPPLYERLMTLEAVGDAKLHDELITLLIAGHETSATTLAWCVHRLFEHPEVAARVVAEIDEHGGEGEAFDVAALPRMKFLDAFVKETLRVNPILPMVGRVLQETAVVGGIEVPRGTLVAPSIYLTHRDPRVWGDPDEFRPERFLERRVGPYEFLPFGGGARRCIGMAFAMMEIKVALATILREWTLSPVPSYRVRLVRRAITFSPSDGMPVIARRR